MIGYLNTSQPYKVCVMLAMTKAVLVIILNLVATMFLLRNYQKSFQYTTNPTSGNRRNEIILSSLCATNILFGFGILIDFGAFISGKQSIIGFLLTSFSLISSLIHISLLTLERFVAVRYPFKYQTFDTKYIFYALAVIWCFSIGIAVATRYHYNTFLLVLCVVVLCSNVVVVISYGYVIFRTRCSSRRLPATTATTHAASSALWYSKEQKEQQNRVTTLCCVIVLTYITTTLPCVICYIIPKYGVYSAPRSVVKLKKWFCFYC